MVTGVCRLAYNFSDKYNSLKNILGFFSVCLHSVLVPVTIAKLFPGVVLKPALFTALCALTALSHSNGHCLEAI